MADQQQAAVYRVLNIKNNKLYIGSSLDYKKRFRTHKSMLRRGVHHAYKLQRAWNKYREKSFLFEPVEHVYFSVGMTKEYKLQILHCIEQYYTDKFQAASKDNYSTTTEVGKFEIKDRSKAVKMGIEKRKLKGEIKLSEEHKKNISEALLNSDNLKKALAINGLKRRKKIYQYDSTGKLINEWNYIQDIVDSSPEFKIEGIRKSLHNYVRAYKGFVFSYIKSDIMLPREAIKPLKSYVIQKDLEGNIVNIFDSLKDVPINSGTIHSYITTGKKYKDHYYSYGQQHR